MSAPAYPQEHIHGLILAGGQGRRLGHIDKAFIQLAGAPLLRHAIQRLSPQCASLTISANGDASRFSSYGIPVIADSIADAGPLAGILAGMDFAAENLLEDTCANEHWILSAPVDCPFLPGDLGRRLFSSLSGDQPLAIAESGGRLHFLCGLWNLSLREPLRHFLDDSDNRRAEAFVRSTGFAGTEWPLQPYDPFANINKPIDIEDAQQIALRLSNTQ